MAPLAHGASSTNLKTQFSFSVWTEAGGWSQSLSPFELSNICSPRHTAYMLEGGVQCSGLIPNYSMLDFCVCVCATIALLFLRAVLCGLNTAPGKEQSCLQ